MCVLIYEDVIEVVVFFSPSWGEHNLVSLIDALFLDVNRGHLFINDGRLKITEIIETCIPVLLPARENFLHATCMKNSGQSWLYLVYV